MEKLKFCEELKKKGFDAFVEGGVVMVKKAGKIEDTIKDLRILAEKLDYKESLGIRAIATDAVQDPITSNAVPTPITPNVAPTPIAPNAVSTPIIPNVAQEDEDDFFDEDEALEETIDGDEPISEIGALAFEQINLFDMM